MVLGSALVVLGVMFGLLIVSVATAVSSWTPMTDQAGGNAVESEAELHWKAMRLNEADWPPIQVTSALLVGDGLHISYLMAKGASVNKAWLETSAGSIPVAPTATPGRLAAEAPPAGGTLTLVIAGVTDPPFGSPALPWRITLGLWRRAVTDWHAAKPCTARLLLPGGDSLGVARILRRPDALMLFSSRSPLTDPGEAPPPLMDVELQADGQPVDRMSYPYGDDDGIEVGDEGDWPLNALPGTPGGPPQMVYVPVARFAPVNRAAQLRLFFPSVTYELDQPWQIEVTVPAERPATMAPSIPIHVQGKEMRLEEISLGRTGTFVVLSAAGLGISRHGEVGLRDISSVEHGLLALTWWKGHVCLVFEPVPEGVTALTVWGEGMRATAPGVWELPLVPPAVVEVES